MRLIEEKSRSEAKAKGIRFRLIDLKVLESQEKERKRASKVCNKLEFC